jgi:hypothetical protein
VFFGSPTLVSVKLVIANSAIVRSANGLLNVMSLLLKPPNGGQTAGSNPAAIISSYKNVGNVNMADLI